MKANTYVLFLLRCHPDDANKYTYMVLIMVLMVVVLFPQNLCCEQTSRGLLCFVIICIEQQKNCYVACFFFLFLMAVGLLFSGG